MKRWHKLAIAISASSLIVVALFIWVFIAISRWYDANQISFHAPVVISFHAPIVIKERGIISPLAEKQTSHGIIPQAYAEEIIEPELTPMELLEKKTKAKWGEKGWEHMHKLIGGESSFDPFAINPTSGACGLFQAYPCSKLPCDLDEIECQIDWGIKYISDRYGSPSKAYAFWLSQSPHWY